MVGNNQAKIFRVGLLGLALVFAVSFSACGDSESSKKESLNAVPEKPLFNGVVQSVVGDAHVKTADDSRRPVVQHREVRPAGTDIHQHASVFSEKVQEGDVRIQ